MSFIETPDAFKGAGIAVVNQEAISKTRELLRLGQLVMGEKKGLLSLRSTSTRLSVPHRVEPDTKLLLDRSMPSSDSSQCPKPTIEEKASRITIDFGVETPDVAMHLILKGRNFDYYNFLDDPYVDMIMDYFRSHLELS